MKKIIGLSMFVFGLLLVAGNVSAATVVEQLQPASDIEYSETLRVPSIYIGAQGVGGVTFFNGTIVNSTTRTVTSAAYPGGAEVDNPVTFGDNVRIDGRVFRGENYGPGLNDDRPFIINDDVEITGTLTMAVSDDSSDSSDSSSSATTVTVGDITSVVAGSGISVIGGSTGDVTVAVADSGINTARLASNAVTSAKIANGTIVDADISDNTNITANNFNYRTSKTGYWSVLGRSLIPYAESAEYTKDLNGRIFNTDDRFSLPVNLPNNAIITGVSALMKDDKVGDSIDIILNRVNLSTASIQIVAILSESQTDGYDIYTEGNYVVQNTDSNDINSSHNQIDNNAYAYDFLVDFDSESADLVLAGIKITYTVTNTLP